MLIHGAGGSHAAQCCQAKGHSPQAELRDVCEPAWSGEPRNTLPDSWAGGRFRSRPRAPCGLAQHPPGWFSTRRVCPRGDTGQCLGTFLVVTARRVVLLLASCRLRPGCCLKCTGQSLTPQRMILPQSERCEAERPEQWGSRGAGPHGTHPANVMSPAGLPGDSPSWELRPAMCCAHTGSDERCRSGGFQKKGHKRLQPGRGGRVEGPGLGSWGRGAGTATRLPPAGVGSTARPTAGRRPHRTAGPRRLRGWQGSSCGGVGRGLGVRSRRRPRVGWGRGQALAGE